MARVNVTIIGLQRLGASFGLALKRATRNPDIKHEFVVTGVDEENALLKAAQKVGAIDQETRDIEGSVERADLVFLAVPAGQMTDIYKLMGPALKPGAVVMDTFAVKQVSISLAKRYFRRNADGQYEAYLVGVRPIVNPLYLDDPRQDTETAAADYFDNGLLMISPAADCPQEAVQLIAELSDLLNVRVQFADPVEHDGLVAGMESLPLLLQMALFRSLSTSRAWGDLQRIGNAEFMLSTHRLIQGSAEDLALPITQNRENTLRALDSLAETLNELRDLLLASDEAMLVEAFGDTMTQYERWYKARQRNNWGDQPEPPAVQTPGLMGSLGNMFLPFGGKKKPGDKQQ